MQKIMNFCIVGIIILTVYGTTVIAAETGVSIPDWINIDVTMVNQIPDPVEPGQYVEVRFKFENTGSENAEDIEVQILPDYPFSLEPGDSQTKYIGSAHGRQIGDIGIIVKYRLKVDENAVEGANDIELRYRINNPGYPPNWIKLEPFTIDVQTHDAILAVSLPCSR